MILQKSILTRQGADFKGTAAATGGLGVGVLCGCSGHEGGGYGRGGRGGWAMFYAGNLCHVARMYQPCESRGLTIRTIMKVGVAKCRGAAIFDDHQR